MLNNINIWVVHRWQHGACALRTGYHKLQMYIHNS